MGRKDPLPLEKVFEYYNKGERVEIWERESAIRYVGHILGFDEHLNIVLKEHTRTVMIKGDCISCIWKRPASDARAGEP
ncbi:small nuclear ribonucleoprotein E [Pancytospora philotis]|nr:small nuclear ribonucleoprotein E [Pancytospora philotis]